MGISPARVAAYEVLLRIERDSAFSSVLLPQYEADLSEKDAGLCHEIVLGVLRQKLALDKRLVAFTQGKKLDTEVLTALRIGGYQILALDRIPDHSAVNESVALVQRAKKSSAKGLVNAVLRRLAKEPPAFGDEDLSHPKWLLDRWADQFGDERAVSIARANNEPPLIAYRMIGGAEAPSGAEPSRIVPGGFVVRRISKHLREMYDDGSLYFQDEASQLIASTVELTDDGSFLDVCAAPGGKTSQIALRYPETRIVAGDMHFKRVQFLRENCIRQGALNVRTLQYDAVESLPFAYGIFESVLVDAPCSGTGTIASNPEIRYSLTPDDISELSSKQLRILENASKVVKSGGRLYYSTCSLERDENEDVISAFLDASNEFSLVVDGFDERFRTPDGFGRTFPDRDGTDGFFFACLTKQ